MKGTAVRLRDLGGTYGGLTGKTKADFGQGSACFVTFLEVINSTRLEGRRLERVRVGKAERQNPVVRGDLLFNGSSETPEEVALSAVVNFDPAPGTFLNSFCFGYRLQRRDVADPTYLAYLFRSSAGRKLVASLAQGATRYNIAKTKFLDVVLNLPHIDRQREVVEALVDGDELITGLEQLIAKREAMKQGMMQQLLTGNTRLPGFTSQWSRVSVGVVADVKTGPFGSALHERDYVSHGTPIITVEHLSERGVVAKSPPMVSETDCQRLRAYTLRTGDVVFSRVGSIDRNALISPSENGWLFSGRLLRVRFDRATADPGFMSAQFHSRAFREAVRSVAVGQTMPSLNTAILNGVLVDLPPLDEQGAIGEVVSDVDRQLDGLHRRLEKAKAVKQGLMEELLTGSARVPIEIAA